MKIRFQERLLIEGRLTARAPLHIGDGEWVRSETRGREGGDEAARPTVATVARDWRGHPYIPGSALRGALRGWLEARFPQEREERIARLFGYQKTRAASPPGTDGEVRAEGYGGKVDFLDAFLDTPEEAAARTEARTRVAIDRKRRAADEHKLFTRQLVPAGTAFAVEILGRGLEPGETALLLLALEAVAKGEIALGKESASALGRLDWEQTALRLMDAEGAAAWWGEADPPPWQARAAPLQGKRLDAVLVAQEALAAQAPVARRLEVDLVLTFDSLFLVRDPERERREKQNGAPDALPRLDTDGRACLPATSFRGCLRAQAERIGNTIGLGGGRGSSAEAQNLEAVKRLPLVARLFGATGWRSPVAVSDFRQIEGTQAPSIQQEFVAIDRFTGGASGKRKFSAAGVYGPVLEGHITVDLGRLGRAGDAEAALGLLLLTLRDLAEGDVTFGFGAAKGYGSCGARVVLRVDGQEQAFFGDWARGCVQELLSFTAGEAA